jgi:hypothetical protein
MNVPFFLDPYPKALAHLLFFNAQSYKVHPSTFFKTFFLLLPFGVHFPNLGKN